MPQPKLLVVDDSQSTRLAISRILKTAGYEVITAINGIEAIDMLAEEPSLMVLDVNMPGLDGYGVCEQLRQFGSKYDNLPIVFLTSLESRALELLGREYGAYLQKPVEDGKLLDVIQHQLQLAGTE